MKKVVAAVQSSYIPWKGYFDLIRAVDEFILLDDAQFTKRDWRSRNRIKTPHGLLWLTIPVKVKGRFRQRICDTEINDPSWKERHWKTIRHNHAQAQYFATYHSFFEELYLGTTAQCLSQVNYRFVRAVCDLLGIRTRLVWSWDYGAVSSGTRRLVELCLRAGASEYLSGPRARSYLDEGAFRAAGIRVRYASYDGYPEYKQLFPPFEHAVSVLDLIFNEGPDAVRYLKCL